MEGMDEEMKSKLDAELQKALKSEEVESGQEANILPNLKLMHSGESLKRKRSQSEEDRRVKSMSIEPFVSEDKQI